MRLLATDRDVEWTLGEQCGTWVRGPAARLVGWLLGREDGGELSASTADGRPPPLPSWI